MPDRFDGDQHIAERKERQGTGEVAMTELRDAVEEAKITAAESLERLNGVSGGHTMSDLVQAHLYEAHLKDRQRLYEAMRRLEDAKVGELAIDGREAAVRSHQRL